MRVLCVVGIFLVAGIFDGIFRRPAEFALEEIGVCIKFCVFCNSNVRRPLPVEVLDIRLRYANGYNRIQKYTNNADLMLILPDKYFKTVFEWRSLT